MSRWDMYPLLFILIGAILLIAGFITLIVSRNNNPQANTPTAVYVLIFLGLGIAFVGAVLAVILLHRSS